MDFLKIFGIASGIFAIILVFLFLSGFYLPGRSRFDLDARSSISSLVRSVSMRGYGLEAKDGVMFTPSETISITDAISSSSINSTQIVFDCYYDGKVFDGFCNPKSVDSPLQFDSNSMPTKIIAKQSAKPAIAVCFGEPGAKSSNMGGTSVIGKYYILIGTVKDKIVLQAAYVCGIG